MSNNDWMLKDPMRDYEVSDTIHFDDYDDTDKPMTTKQVVLFGFLLCVTCVTIMMAVFALLSMYAQ